MSKCLGSLTELLQRTNPEKCRNRICITSDIRKQINEMNQKEKDEQERKHGGEEKLKVSPETELNIYFLSYQVK